MKTIILQLFLQYVNTSIMNEIGTSKNKNVIGEDNINQDN